MYEVQPLQHMPDAIEAFFAILAGNHRRAFDRALYLVIAAIVVVALSQFGPYVYGLLAW